MSHKNPFRVRALRSDYLFLKRYLVAVAAASLLAVLALQQFTSAAPTGTPPAGNASPNFSAVTVEGTLDVKGGEITNTNYTPVKFPQGIKVKQFIALDATGQPGSPLSDIQVFGNLVLTGAINNAGLLPLILGSNSGIKIPNIVTFKQDKQESVMDVGTSPLRISTSSGVYAKAFGDIRRMAIASKTVGNKKGIQSQSVSCPPNYVVLSCEGRMDTDAFSAGNINQTQWGKDAYFLASSVDSTNSANPMCTANVFVPNDIATSLTYFNLLKFSAEALCWNPNVADTGNAK